MMWSGFRADVRAGSGFDTLGAEIPGPGCSIADLGRRRSCAGRIKADSIPESAQDRNYVWFAGSGFARRHACGWQWTSWNPLFLTGLVETGFLDKCQYWRLPMGKVTQ
jgi:hypothetical protein